MFGIGYLSMFNIVFHDPFKIITNPNSPIFSKSDTPEEIHTEKGTDLIKDLETIQYKLVCTFSRKANSTKRGVQQYTTRDTTSFVMYIHSCIFKAPNPISTVKFLSQSLSSRFALDPCTTNNSKWYNFFKYAILAFAMTLGIKPEYMCNYHFAVLREISVLHYFSPTKANEKLLSISISQQIPYIFSLHR